MMQLTLENACRVVREELGRDPAKSSVEALVNEAGERWVSAENWRYLRNRTESLTLEAGVEDYPLGAGVQSIGRILHRPDSVWAPLELLEFSEFTAYRERYLAGVSNPFNPVATTVWDVKEGDDHKKLYLRIFPARVSERVVVEYRGGWVPMDESDDVADLPPPLVVHFRDWLRIYALHREFPQAHPIGTLDAYMQSASFMEAQRQDAESVGRIMPRCGKIGENYNRTKGVSRHRYEALRYWSERGGFPG